MTKYRKKKGISEKYRKYKREWYQEEKKNHPEVYMWRGAKYRATKNGIEFNIEVSDIKIPKKCPILKLKLEMNEYAPRANSPTVDRVDNNKGYVKGNVRVISSKANLLKSDLSVPEIERLLKYSKGEI